MNGTVTLNNATLSGDTTGFTPGTGHYFIILNDSTDAVVGTFNNQSNGSLANFTGFSANIANISYFGNSSNDTLTGGNDVVLYNFTATPEPSFLLAVAFAGTCLYTTLRRSKGLSRFMVVE